MAKIELYIPAMGEGIIEATITRWFKKEGERIERDESVVEIATDKVDSEVPSPASGIIEKILCPEGKTAKVGEIIAIIDANPDSVEILVDPEINVEELKVDTAGLERIAINAVTLTEPVERNSEIKRFLSPLVKSIIATEKISDDELNSIKGSGLDGRLTKDDIFGWLRKRTAASVKTEPAFEPVKEPVQIPVQEFTVPSPVHQEPMGISSVRVIEMDRLRRLTAEHTLKSKQISPHVTSFLEVDVTGIVHWRNGIREEFKQKTGENITFTPIFVEAVVKALKDHPMINISVEGNNILVKNYINIGLATNLPSGNLIVPVIKNADSKNLVEITQSVNDLAKRARENRLMPDDIRSGTFTITNLGTFGVLAGTPIINQPEVAILGIGAIVKKPAVIETETGDAIAIRNIVMLSLSFDHRVIDGYAAGVFMKRIAEVLETFDIKRKLW